MKNLVKCGNADRYKALRPPKCGCDMCALKYRLAELERKYGELADALGVAKDSANAANSAASAALYVANLR
jgi:hypothetical protein